MDLPHYSSKDIMMERLITSIRLCGEIDGDAEYNPETVESIDNDLREGVDERDSDEGLDIENYEYDNLDTEDVDESWGELSDEQNKE